MARDEEAEPLQPGEQFRNYAIRSRLGCGRFTWVYEAYDNFSKREVAIKVLRRPGRANRQLLRRGRSEAEFLVQLQHRNVVKVHDAGVVQDGFVYVVMELLRGRTLRQALVEHGKLSLNQALDTFLQVAAGVEAGHGLGAIHRDLKPENVFITRDNLVKVLDFGIAKLLAGGEVPGRTAIHGTLSYMSPEHVQGFGVTPRSDVYALGLMLHEALLGKHPYRWFADSPTAEELARIQVLCVPPMLNEVDPSIPRHVARVVQRALSKVAEQRYGSVFDLAEALERCAERSGPRPRRGYPARSDLAEVEPVPAAVRSETPAEPATLDPPRTDPSAKPERPTTASGRTAPPVTAPVEDQSKAGFGNLIEPGSGSRAALYVVAVAAAVGIPLGIVSYYFRAPVPHQSPSAWSASGSNGTAPGAAGRDAAQPRATAPATESQSAPSSAHRRAPSPPGTEASARSTTRERVKKPGAEAKDASAEDAAPSEGLEQPAGTRDQDPQ